MRSPSASCDTATLGSGCTRCTTVRTLRVQTHATRALPAPPRPARRLRHSNEALPLRLSKEHPDLDENEGSHSFVEAIEKTLHTEMDSDVLKMQPSIDNVVKKMTSAKRGGMEPGSDGVDGGSGRASSSGPRLSGNQVPGRPASGNGAQQGDTSATGPSRLSNVSCAPG